MKQRFHINGPMTVGLFLVCSSLLLQAQSKDLKAEVWDIRGPATYTTAGSPPRPLQAGTVIPSGSVVKTGLGAAIDISFGKSIGWIRLPQNTVISFDKLALGEPKDGPFDIQLVLTEGGLLGEVREVPETGKFDVKTPTELAGVRGGKFRIQAEGYIVLLSGVLINVHIPSSGDPVLHKLNAPPPVYFSPSEGVRAAPGPLIQEVQGQLQARLRTP